MWYVILQACSESAVSWNQKCLHRETYQSHSWLTSTGSLQNEGSNSFSLPRLPPWPHAPNAMALFTNADFHRKWAHMETLHCFEHDQAPWAKPLRSRLQAPLTGPSTGEAPPVSQSQTRSLIYVEANSWGSWNDFVLRLSSEQFAYEDSTRCYMPVLT